MRMLRVWFWTAFYKFEYRKIDPDVCCCGSSTCDADMSHSYTNAKEYAIKSSVKRKLIK